MELVIEIAALLFVYATAWFIISLVLKRNDVADIAWGLGYVLVCLYLFLTQPDHPISLLCYSLVTIWGLRLSYYIHKRNRNKPEDFRYKNWRQEWGSTFYWRSYLQVYLLQAFFLLVISSPVILAASSDHSEWNWVSGVAALIWLIGFYWQAVGDYQLAQFIKKRESLNEIMTQGLWAYSRHPNYFGEIVMWWGIFVVTIPTDLSYLGIVGPITITFLIRYVSGVPLLERRYDNNITYQEYKTKVPALIPRIWLMKFVSIKKLNFLS